MNIKNWVGVGAKSANAQVLENYVTTAFSIEHCPEKHNLKM